MSLFIGDSVVRICDSAFAQITTFFRLEIGQSVAHIGYHAFKNARIDTIVSHAVIAPTLGDTVNVYNPETEEFEDTYLNAFGKDYFSNPYVRIPCGSYGSYSQDHHWTDVFDRIYEEIDYEVTANAANGGKAFVLEMICEDQKAVIKAEPDYGYMFSNWSDGNTDNPRTLYLTQDTVLTAFFTPTAICENGETAVSVYPNPTDGTFAIEAENITNVEIFDLAGQKVLTDRSGSRTINAGSLPTGVYFLKVETPAGTKYGKLVKK